MTRLAVAALVLVCAPATANAEEEATTEVRESIARALDADAAPWAATVRNPEATVTRLPTPAWLPGKIWRVERFLPTRPLLFYVAAGPRSIAPLTGKPEAFNRWMQGEGVRVPNAAGAVELARLFVESTRNTGTRMQLIESVDAIPYRPGLSGHDAEVRDKSKPELARTIRAPRAFSRDHRGWQVVGFAVEGARIVRLKMMVSVGGEVEMRSETIRTDLPLIYAN